MSSKDLADDLRMAASAARNSTSQPAPWTDLARLTARLMEEAAALVETHPQLRHRHVDGEPCDDHACRITHVALEFADVLRRGVLTR